MSRPRGYCLFGSPVEGDRNGTMALLQHRDTHDPETGCRYTVKAYEGRRDRMSAGTWRHVGIVVMPLHAAFIPITPAADSEDEVQVVAVVEVLRA
jgi:hypothetical protein